MIEAKTIYLKHVKSGKLSGYILGHKYYKLRSFCFPLNELNRFNKKLDLINAPIYDFSKNANIELYNEDANKIIDDNDNEQSLTFLDPPYIASCNNFYSTDTGENICNIYEKLYYYKLKNYKCKMLICHENNWLYKILFNDYLDGETECQGQLNQNMLLSMKHTSDALQTLGLTASDADNIMLDLEDTTSDSVCVCALDKLRQTEKTVG